MDQLSHLTQQDHVNPSSKKAPMEIEERCLQSMPPKLQNKQHLVQSLQRHSKIVVRTEIHSEISILH
ncbi:hypothetical protein QG37_00877 [Candidozyma auris]|nr:hypothetical protein QG37_00877 [[Candida] auris]